MIPVANNAIPISSLDEVKKYRPIRITNKLRIIKIGLDFFLYSHDVICSSIILVILKLPN